jgi:toxin ParE1/3/4
MNSFRLSPVARSDLDEIWFYIAQDDLDAQINSSAPLFRDSRNSQPFAAMPRLGRKREELSPRLRSFPVGRYVIFYRPMENGIEIVRVLHGARDLPPLFA